MSHECSKNEAITKLQENMASAMADISNIKEDKAEDVNWKVRIEEKVDKLLWFFLGQSVTLILTVLGGVVIYAITR